MAIRKKKLSGIEQLEVKIKKEYKFLKKLKEKNEDHLLFAAFIVVVASAVVINTIYVINRVPALHDRLVPTHASGANKVLTSLQKAETDAYTVQVSNVTVTDKVDRAFSTVPADIMLIMDISITNTSNGSQQLVPANQFFVRDRQGGLYMLHPSSFATKPLELSSLEPGKTATGQLSFAIPKILAHPLLYIDLGWNDNTPAVIDVMK